MRSSSFLLAVIAVFLVFSAKGMAESCWLHGEILEVFPAENKVRILSDGQVLILELTETAGIYRKGQIISLISARPITSDRFQEGLFFLNAKGKVEIMIVDYRIEEVTNEFGTFVIYYDIFGQVKDVEQIPPVLEGIANL